SRSRALSMVSEAALRLVSCLDRLPETLAILVRYCASVASSRLMRSTRTAEIGSSEGRSMRSPLAICCISLPSLAELLFSEPCMVAVIWALEMRMEFFSSGGSEHRQYGVEQLVGGADHLHVGLVGLLVGHQVDRFLVEVHRADAVALGLRLLGNGGGGGMIGLVLPAGAGDAPDQPGIGVVQRHRIATDGDARRLGAEQRQQCLVVADFAGHRGQCQLLGR